MKKIDEVLEGEPKWVRFFVSKSVRYGWIGARHTFSKFSAIEKILDGAQDKDIDKVAKGVVEFALGGIFTTILFEVIK